MQEKIGRSYECLLNQSVGVRKVSKSICKNNCKRSDCKYIGGRHK